MAKDRLSRTNQNGMLMLVMFFAFWPLLLLFGVKALGMVGSGISRTIR